MDYVVLLKWRESASPAERDAALVRRAGWQYPSGLKVIAEYWPLSSACQVVSIVSADDLGAILEMVFEWDDVFHVDISPAVSAEEGLKLGAEAMSRVPRLQSQ